MRFLLRLTHFRALNRLFGQDRIVEMSEEDANCLIPVGWTLLTEPDREASG
jgi:hypothetical protein